LSRGSDIFATPHFERDDLDAKLGSCFLKLAHVQLQKGIIGVGQDRQSVQIRDDLAQEFDALAGNIGSLA
jgi:hypothetical protein